MLRRHKWVKVTPNPQSPFAKGSFWWQCEKCDMTSFSPEKPTGRFPKCIKSPTAKIIYPVE